MSEEIYLKWPAKLWQLKNCRSLSMTANTLNLFLVVLWNHQSWMCFFVFNQILYMEIGRVKE